jgi:hypothetical protein
MRSTEYVKTMYGPDGVEEVTVGYINPPSLISTLRLATQRVWRILVRRLR